MRWLIRSAPNSKPNGNISTLHATWFSLGKKKKMNDFTSYTEKTIFSLGCCSQRFTMISIIIPWLVMVQALLRLARSELGAPSGVTKTAGWVVGLYFPFVLTDKNELHHTPYSTWEVLRNGDFRMTLNRMLASLMVVLLNKHIFLKHFCHGGYIIARHDFVVSLTCNARDLPVTCSLRCSTQV